MSQVGGATGRGAEKEAIEGARSKRVSLRYGRTPAAEASRGRRIANACGVGAGAPQMAFDIQKLSHGATHL